MNEGPQTKKKNRLRDLFLYGGLTEEEYRSVKPAARKSNFRSCHYISLASAILLAAMAVASLHIPSLHTSFRLYLQTAIVAAAICALTFVRRFESTPSATVFSYLVMLLGYGYGFGLTFGTRLRKDTPAVTLVVLIVLVPMITTDVLWRILLLDLSVLLLFLLRSWSFDTPDIFNLNLVNAGTLSFVGLLFYIIVSTQNFRRMAEEQHVRNITVQTVQTLANAIDAKDRYTNGHSYRVSEYSILIARELGWSEEEINTLQIEALLHDVGKIGVPDTILNKPGRLTDLEYNIIQSHTELGASILKNATSISGAEAVALCHHERYDGKGYPNGLAGTDIPLHARVVAVADAYDAMNSDRIYRKALSGDRILEELRRGRGTQFDPDCLDAFLRILEEGRLKIGRTGPLGMDRRSGESFPVDIFARDVESLLEQAQATEQMKGAFSVSLDSFTDLYNYVRNVGERYDLDVNMILMDVTPADPASVTDALQSEAIRSMELAIRETIRNVDICAPCSKTQVLVIFLGAGAENIDMIIQRIYVNYYKIFDSRAFKLSYRITDGSDS